MFMEIRFYLTFASIQIPFLWLVRVNALAATCICRNKKKKVLKVIVIDTDTKDKRKLPLSQIVGCAFSNSMMVSKIIDARDTRRRTVV
jgi:hypothetical protein